MPERVGRRHRLVFVAVCAAVGAVLALPAGWLWSVVAEGGEGTAFDGEVFLNEGQLNAQSAMTMWFIVVGVVWGLVAGLVVALLGKRHGVAAVVAVIVMCAVASVLTGLLGVWLFGPDEAAQLGVAADGDTIAIDLEVATWVAYLAWPIGGLIGALAAIAGWPRESARSTPA